MSGSGSGDNIAAADAGGELVRRSSSEENGATWVREQKKSHQLWIANKANSIERLRGIAIIQRKREQNCAEKQSRAAAEIVKRLDVWMASAKAMKEYVSRRKAAVSGFGSVEQSPFSGNEIGKVMEVNQSDQVWKNVAQQAAINLGKDLGEKADSHVKEMESAAKRLNLAVKKTLMDMDVKKNQLKDIWSVYYEHSMLHIRALEAGVASAYDPLISGRKYEHALVEFRAQQKVFSEEMEKILNEVKTIDESRISTLQTIMHDYLVSEYETLRILLKTNEDSQFMVKTIDPKRDMEEFVTFASFYENLQSSVSVFNNPDFEEEDKDILSNVHETIQIDAILHRPGQIVKSKWHEVYVTISSSGYFYQFESKQSLEPNLKIRLDSEVKIKHAPDCDLLAFSLYVPDNSFFGFSGPNQHRFKVSSQEELVQWMTIISNHIKNTPFSP